MNRRLGRGLDFLLSGGEQEGDESPAAPTHVDVKKVSSNPWQPRTEFDEDGLEELAASIKSHGVMQPIIVRRKQSGGFELVAGERRLLASKRAGLREVPAIVKELDDRQMLVLAIVENLQRRDLGPIEKARAFRRLADEQGLSHQQIASAVGVGRSTVSNTMRLLELSEPILAAVTSGRLSEGHARSLLSVAEGPERDTLFEEYLEDNLTVRQAEDKAHSSGKKKSKRRSPSREARALQQELTEAVGLKVQIREKGKGGRVEISYTSLEQFDDLFERLTGHRPDL